MNWADRMRVIDAANERRTAIMREKNEEYTNESLDTLANFKNVGSRLGHSPFDSCATYVNKHFDSFNTFVLRLERLLSAETIVFADAQALVSEGEGIVSRLDDIRNYMDIFECLLVDQGLIGGPDKPYTELKPGPTPFLKVLEAEVGTLQTETFGEWAKRHRGVR